MKAPPPSPPIAGGVLDSAEGIIAVVVVEVGNDACVAPQALYAAVAAMFPFTHRICLRTIFLSMEMKNEE